MKAECAKFSEDVKYWAEFQTGIKAFSPWLKKAEDRKNEGMKKPTSLVEACEILGDAKVGNTHFCLEWRCRLKYNGSWPLLCRRVATIFIILVKL